MQICLQIFVYFSMPGRLSNGNTKMLKNANQNGHQVIGQNGLTRVTDAWRLRKGSGAK